MQNYVSPHNGSNAKLPKCCTFLTKNKMIEKLQYIATFRVAQ